MKKKTLGLFTLLPAMALIIGGGFALANATTETIEPEVVKAEMSTEPLEAGDNIYVKLKVGYWAAASADIYLDVWASGSSTTTITLATSVVNTSKDVIIVHPLTSGEATAIASATNFTFRRLQAGSSTQWNYWTASLSDIEYYNYFTISGWDNAGSYNWEKENTVYFQRDSHASSAEKWTSSVYAYPYISDESIATYPAFPGVATIKSTNSSNFKYAEKYSHIASDGSIRSIKLIEEFDRVIFAGYPSGWKTALQTENLVVADGAYYNWSLNYSGSGTTTGSTALGLAAKFVYDADNAIKSVAASSDDILSGSICGLTSTEAATLYAEYQAITDEDALAITNSSTIYTYSPSDSSVQDDVTYEAIAAQLALLANSSSSSSQYALTASDNSAYIAIGAIAGVAILAAAGFIFYRKKRVVE